MYEICYKNFNNYLNWSLKVILIVEEDICLIFILKFNHHSNNVSFYLSNYQETCQLKATLYIYDSQPIRIEYSEYHPIRVA